MQLQVERMVATKRNSIQTYEDFLEGEELCVAGIWCVYQECGVGIRLEREFKMNEKDTTCMNVLIV